MDVINNLFMGFSVALSPVNFLMLIFAVVVGTLVGAMPGIGPVSAVSILIPLSIGMGPTTTMIMMAGIYYGGMYGGTITSVLMNVPGESSSIMTCLDGYAMARKGRAGSALTISAVGSFIAGTFSTIALMLLGPPIADTALQFGPPENFALMMLGMTAISGLTGSSVVKGYTSAFLGLGLAMVGMDVIGGFQRFTFGSLELQDGIDFLPIAIGMFGIAEIAIAVEHPERYEAIKTSLREMIITLQEIKDSVMPTIRGTLIGFAIGVLPGAGPTIATFLAYSAEKRVSKHPELFGTGVMAGVAAPESANNAASVGAMVPMLTIGIPGSGTTAVMLGALSLFDVQPGPFLFTKHPDLVWGLIASMYLGNVVLLLLNVLFVPAFVSVMRVPPQIYSPLVVLFSVVGVYALNYSVFDLWLMFGAGVIGYFMKRLDYPVAPLVLALVLGGRMEKTFRQSLKMSLGDVSIFFTRPISVVIMVVVIVIMVWPLLNRFVLRRSVAERRLP